MIYVSLSNMSLYAQISTESPIQNEAESSRLEPSIENVVLELQEDESVLIKYDLVQDETSIKWEETANQKTYTIVVEILCENVDGKTIVNPSVEALEGDLNNATIGKGKKIVWHLDKEADNLILKGKLKAKLMPIAEEGNKGIEDVEVVEKETKLQKTKKKRFARNVKKENSKNIEDIEAEEPLELQLELDTEAHANALESIGEQTENQENIETHEEEDGEINSINTNPNRVKSPKSVEPPANAVIHKPFPIGKTPEKTSYYERFALTDEERELLLSNGNPFVEDAKAALGIVEEDETSESSDAIEEMQKKANNNPQNTEIVGPYAEYLKRVKRLNRKK